MLSECWERGMEREMGERREMGEGERSSQCVGSTQGCMCVHE